MDFDVVEESNLQRQVVHGSSSLGKSKLESAKARLLDLNPGIEVETHEVAINSENALQLIDQKIKAFALLKYPNDYQMQKYTYDRQLKAKEYMQQATDEKAKSVALEKYPTDYTMQKYTYDNFVSRNK